MGGAIIAVPWRGGDASRERAWEVVSRHLATVGIPVVTGDSDPARPFVLAEARNVAAESVDWDVVFFCDADTLFTVDAIRSAIDTAAQTDRPVYPCTAYVDLDFDTGLPDATSPNGNGPAGGCVAYSREVWESVGGGWDERFTSYGWEDLALICLSYRLLGWPLLVEGTGVRLGHGRTEAETRSGDDARTPLERRYRRLGDLIGDEAEKTVEALQLAAESREYRLAQRQTQLGA